MTRVKLKEQYISHLPLLQTLNNISVIMLLRTFNIISLILDMRKGDYVILQFFFLYILTVTGIVYEGCFPNFEVSSTFMYENATSMTVEACFDACSGSGHDYVGMQVSY